MYAVLEPLYVLLLRRLPIDPFMYSVGSGMMYLILRLRIPGRPRMLSRVEGREVDEKCIDEQRPPKRQEKDYMQTLDETIARYLPLHLLAISNASLQNLVQSLTIPQPTFILYLSLFAWIIFLCIRIRDYELCRSSDRPLYLGQCGLDYTLEQFSYLACMLTLRVVLRLALGLPVPGMLETRDESTATELFGQQRFEANYQFVEKVPRWARWVLQALNLVLAFAAGRMYAWERAHW